MKYQTHLQGKPYMRISFRDINGKKCREWALKISNTMYKILRKDGSAKERKVKGGYTEEMVACTKKDSTLVEEQARMNLHYAELEVVNDV